jgi:hypothetical protein
MTTDTALGVSKKVVHDKSLCSVSYLAIHLILIGNIVPLDKIPYVVSTVITTPMVDTDITLVC